MYLFSNSCMSFDLLSFRPLMYKKNYIADVQPDHTFRNQTIWADVSHSPKPIHLQNILPNAYLHPDPTRPYNESVLVFLHNPKSGGTTVKTCMVKMSQAEGDDRRPTLVAGPRAIDVPNELINGAVSVNKYYMGTSAFGMCRFVGGRACSYFTMVREPYDRVVSHYYFCRSGGPTPMSCDGTLEDFARHTCNLIFFQMIHRYLCRHEIPGVDASPWRCRDVGGGLHTVEQRGRQLDYILENMDKIFAVVGITEEFETSLRLLENTFGRPFHSMCHADHANTGTYEQDEAKANEKGERLRVHAEAKERLVKNEELRKCFHEDIIIYNKMKEIFEKQKKSFFGAGL